ncbi:hypothetical protein HKX48_002014, partial [Thoreauomyces humboldtii]
MPAALTFASRSGSPSERLTATLDELLDVFFKEHPTSGSMIDYPKYRDEIFDLSNQPAFFAAMAGLTQELGVLTQSDLLSDEEKDLIVLAKGFVGKAVLSARIDSRQDMPCSHMMGCIPQLWMGLVHGSAFKTKTDVENFRLRLDKIAPRMEQVIAGFRQGIQSGYTLPLRSIDSLIESCGRFITEDEDASTHPWNVVEKVTAVGLSSHFLLDSIRTSVVPAHRGFRKFLQEEYRPHARTRDGIYGLPGSAEMYRGCIEYHTDSSGLSPDELHQMGLKEVARIRREMDETIREVGFLGSIKEFNVALRDRKRYPELFLESEADIIPRYREIVETVNEKMPELFNKLPKATVIMEPVPEHQKRSVPDAMYFPGNRDTPGKFLVNLELCKDAPTNDMVATALHEANPGHHHQWSRALEREVDHNVRRMIFSTAWAEGWGLYSEFLGKEMGMYHDPFDYFGRLQLDMLRSLRLVVDTGLHHLGWSIEKVKETMAEYIPGSPQASDAEVLRYATMPGQAMSYKIGEMAIRKLRERATTRLGDRFDV